MKKRKHQSKDYKNSMKIFVEKKRDLMRFTKKMKKNRENLTKKFKGFNNKEGSKGIVLIQ